MCLVTVCCSEKFLFFAHKSHNWRHQPWETTVKGSFFKKEPNVGYYSISILAISEKVFFQLNLGIWSKSKLWIINYDRCPLTDLVAWKMIWKYHDCAATINRNSLLGTDLILGLTYADCWVLSLFAQFDFQSLLG